MCLEIYKVAPHDANLLLLLGATYFQAKDYAMSLKFSEMAAAARPDFAEALGNIGNVYKDRGDLQRALSYYHRAAAIKPAFADVQANMGSVYLQLGRNTEALGHYECAVALNPGVASWQVDRGHLYRLFGHIDRARECFLIAVRLQPRFAIAWSNLACVDKDQGRIDDAIAHYRTAIECDPSFNDAYANLGNVYKDSGRLAEARTVYEHALVLNPANAVIHGNLAATLLELGLTEMSLGVFDAALRLQPDFPDALSNRGNAYKILGRIPDAVASYEAALRCNPNHPDALNNLANTYKDLGRAVEAEALYRKAVAARPDFAGAHSNLGNLLKEQHKLHESLQAYQMAIACDPHFADAYSNMGNSLKDLGRFDEAIAAYQSAIAIRPSFADAYANLASVYKDSGRLEVAIVKYRRALQMKEAEGKPTDPIAWCNLVHCLQTVCDWAGRDSVFAKTWDIIHIQMASGQVPAVQPHHALVYPFSAAKQVEIAQHYAAAALRAVRSLSLVPFTYDDAALVARLSPATRRRRIRLGYVSSDFGNHPLAHLMQNVFVWHDPSVFEVFCYATTASDGSVWRQRVQSGVEHFKEVAALSHGDLAAMIHADEIDVLVNLNGYTRGSRNEVFALQPAPIQVMYMGFPGSSGSDYMQYFVTDANASPPELSELYTERLAYMPHCYFVNDHAQSYTGAVDSLVPLDDAATNAMRARYGLPPRPAPVFCMFNQLYKIDPAIFEVWMRILARVPSAVLWLLQFPASGEVHIRNEARKRGIADERLVFSPVASKEEHISRGRAADLFLDTTLCNAHTTATDILWAGTPLLTLPGETLASRVAASIACALNCPEMITTSLEHYEETAVALATDMASLRALQAKVRDARVTSPLFNTRQWVHDLGRLVLAMVDDFVSECYEGRRAPLSAEGVGVPGARSGGAPVSIPAETFGDGIVKLAPPAPPAPAPPMYSAPVPVAPSSAMAPHPAAMTAPHGFVVASAPLYPAAAGAAAAGAAAVAGAGVDGGVAMSVGPRGAAPLLGVQVVPSDAATAGARGADGAAGPPVASMHHAKARQVHGAGAGAAASAGADAVSAATGAYPADFGGAPAHFAEAGAEGGDIRLTGAGAPMPAWGHMAAGGGGSFLAPAGPAGAPLHAHGAWGAYPNHAVAVPDRRMVGTRL